MPDEIKPYRCNTCKKIINVTYDEAKKHEPIEPDKPLLKGFSFRISGEKNGIVSVIISEGEMISGLEKESIREGYTPHTHNHKIILISLNDGVSNGIPDMNSEAARKNLEDKYKFLSKDEYEALQKWKGRLRKYFGIEELIRHPDEKEKYTNYDTQRLSDLFKKGRKDLEAALKEAGKSPEEIKEILRPRNS